MITVTVTEGDRDEGQKGSPYHCPIAIAMSRQGFERPCACPDELFFNVDGKPMAVKPPAIVGEYIAFFDHGPFYGDGTTEWRYPFSFELDPARFYHEKQLHERAMKRDIP